MSNLLEQAIIDAAALREVAMKNAESALIEKYSKEFNESVQKLLEQETASADPAAATDDPAADPLASPAIADPSLDMSGMGGDMDMEKEKAFDSVPSSFLDGDDNELITIDFDQLKKQVSGAMGIGSSLLSSPQAASTPEASAQPMMENVEIAEEELEEAYEQGNKDIAGAKDALAEEEEQEELDETLVIKLKDALSGEEEQEYEFEGWQGEEQEELEETDLAAAADKAASTKIVAGKAEGDYLKAQADAARRQAAEEEAAEEASEKSRMSVSEDIQITEEELAELAEELKVDIDPEHQLRGYMGTTNTERKLADNADKAAARDAKATEEREEEIKAMGDLKAKLDEAIEIGSALATENDELRERLAEMEGNLDSLKENVEKLSISNAKLLYTNKVLGNSSLNERQKEQIVENISKSTSVLEAKTIYNTLQSTVATVSSEKKSKESLSEALIRGNSPFLTRKKQESDVPFAERMKLLAGITNK